MGFFWNVVFDNLLEFHYFFFVSTCFLSVEIYENEKTGGI